MTLHLVIEYNWLHELGAHQIFFCPLCHCCYIPRAWIRIRVYVWRWVSACKYIYTYMYVLVLTYISVHMGIVIFLLHMYYLWMKYICLMQLLFNFGNKLIFIVIVIVIVKLTNPLSFQIIFPKINRLIFYETHINHFQLINLSYTICIKQRKEESMQRAPVVTWLYIMK